MYLFESIYPSSLMFLTPPPSLHSFVIVAETGECWFRFLIHRRCWVPGQQSYFIDGLCCFLCFIPSAEADILFPFSGPFVSSGWTLCLCVLRLTCWAVQTESWTWQEVARYRVVLCDDPLVYLNHRCCPVVCSLPKVQSVSHHWPFKLLTFGLYWLSTK